MRFLLQFVSLCSIIENMSGCTNIRRLDDISECSRHIVSSVELYPLPLTMCLFINNEYSGIGSLFFITGLSLYRV